MTFAFLLHTHLFNENCKRSAMIMDSPRRSLEHSIGQRGARLLADRTADRVYVLITRKRMIILPNSMVGDRLVCPNINTVSTGRASFSLIKLLLRIVDVMSVATEELN